ncbi:tyrosine-protein phosphatase [Microlunatus sp. Y2014]|uniref:tyrosine-protein phosphatase n=1 Tax=Microlunatus sp. Y2014 TaxID=3418488 RepID=UPI003DA7259B
MSVMQWDGVANVRDVGGLPLTGNRLTASGVVIRSAALDQLTARGREQLLALQPSRIIDLRSEHELSQRSPVADLAAFRHLPFVDPTRDGERDPSTERTRFDLYRGSLHRNGRHVARIWTEIAEADGPVIVHCRSGVDRTGMLIALLLSVAGVEAPAIAEDYAVQYGGDANLSDSSASPRDPQRSAWAGTKPGAQTMLDILGWIDANFGSTADYLAAHGVTSAQIETIRHRLTEPTATR